MFLGTGLSWHTWPACYSAQLGWIPSCIHLEGILVEEGKRWDCQIVTQILPLTSCYCILHYIRIWLRYMIGKANILNKEHFWEKTVGLITRMPFKKRVLGSSEIPCLKARNTRISPVFPYLMPKWYIFLSARKISFKLFLPTNWIIHLQPNLAMSNSKYQAGNESMKISPDRHKVGTVYLRGPLVSLTTSSLTFGKKLSLLIVLQMICSKFCLQLGGLIGLATMKRCDSVWVAPTYQLYTPQQTEKHIGTWNWNGKETGDSYWKPSFVWGIQPPAVRTLGCVVHDLGKLDSFRPDDTRNRRTASFVGLNSWNLGTRWKLIAFILTWIISRRMASELWRYTLEFIYRQNFASFFSFLEIVSIASFFHVRIHHLIVSLFGFVSQPCHFA